MERDLVEYIAKSLVDDPSAVTVNVIEEDKSTILELRVASDDIGGGGVLAVEGQAGPGLPSGAHATGSRME
ncbi:MAG: KH domain-containing protein [Spirochaetota bacterium]